MKKFLLFATLSLVCVSVYAQTLTAYEEISERPERAGGVYKAYPSDEIRPLSAAVPAGYEPVYISHYGRHGSRYLVKDEHYTKVGTIFDKAHRANALTPLGENIRQLLVSVLDEGVGRAGDLSPLGARQHREIARRMVENYPHVFVAGSKVAARCTMSNRCAMSMNAFTNSLCANAPQVDVECEMSERNVGYLNYHTKAAKVWADKDNGPWVPDYKAFRDSMTKPDRLVSIVFSDLKYVADSVDAKGFMRALFEIAIDLQNMEVEGNLLQYFTTDELFNLWQIANFSMFAQRGNHPATDGMNLACAHRLVKNIVECADYALAKDSPSVDLRFGHDGNLIPLLGLLQVKGFEKECGNPHELHIYYRNYRAVPMAANLQFVFFKNKNDKSAPIYVRLLHNENEAHLPIAHAVDGFYDWNDLRAYMLDVVAPYTGL